MTALRTSAFIMVATVAAVSPAAAGDGPSVAMIQLAYEEAKAQAKAPHDDALVIREAECQDMRDGQVSCQVGFTDERSSNGRLYFDVIGLDRAPAGWRLVSGLCQR